MIKKIFRIYVLSTLILLIEYGCAICNAFGQDFKHPRIKPIFQLEKLDTTFKQPKIFYEPDTIDYKFIKSLSATKSNFNYTAYANFLNRISDTSKYIVVPLNEFKNVSNPKKVVIGLRHDVDLDLSMAYNLSAVENNFDFRSTYFILHTASYYLEGSSMAIHNESIIPTLKAMQNEYHHEIGWHNDLVTLQLVYDIDPIMFLHQELNWLKSNSLNVTGTASHGSNYCYTYKYLNYYFFEECKNPTVGQFVNNESAVVGGKTVYLKHGHLSDFGLGYEAYFMNNNKYYSDASSVNGQRWNFSMLDLNSLTPGDRVIILMHPCYYSSVGSNLSEITAFSIANQISSTMDPISSKILIEMPNGVSPKNLISNFSLSPEARARVNSKEFRSNFTEVDYTYPVKIKVIAENGLNYKIWTATVINSGSSLLLSSKNLSIGAPLNSIASFNITSNTLWKIATDADWLTADFKSGTNNGMVNLTALANPTTSPRHAVITLSGAGIIDQTIDVVQDAGPPTLSVSASSISVSGIANSACSFNILSNTSWSLSRSENWISTDLLTGNNNRTINLTVQANNSISTRQAILTVSGVGLASQSITVTQEAGSAISLTLSKSTISIGATANSIENFNITSNTNWSIASSASWLLANISSGSNNGTIILSAQVNPTTSTRHATITISGSSFTAKTIDVIQDAGVATLALSNSMLTISATSNSVVSFSISTNTAWNITSADTWLSADYTSGNNDKTITLTAQENPTTATRQTTITVRGTGVDSKAISITQVASPPLLIVSRSALTIGASTNSTVNFDVTSNTSWNVTSSEPWLSANSSRGNSNRTITITAQGNKTGISRQAIITISGAGVADRKVTIYQDALSLLTSTSSLSIGSLVNSIVSFDIISNTLWSLASSDEWLSSNTENGIGTSTVILTAQANPTILTRQAAITIIGNDVPNKTLFVTQEAGAAALSPSANMLKIGALENSTVSFDIISNTAWSILCNESWLTSSILKGISNGTIILTANANPYAIERQAVVAISGEGVVSHEITVIQDAGSTGVNEDNSTQVSIFPNPAQTSIFIKGLTKRSAITIFDAKGKIVYENRIVDNCLDVSNLINGFYTLKIVGSDGVTIRKFVKK